MALQNGQQKHSQGWAAEAREWIRDEPALAWFLSQAVYLAQPVLEAFWPSDAIERFALDLTDPETDWPEAAGADTNPIK
jgi:hypothetical protein